MNAGSTNGYFMVQAVLINKNENLWQRYLECRASLHDVERPPRTAAAQSILGDIHSERNERALFHGTSMDNAAAISGEGFKLALAGKGAFGQGIYFADSPFKSDSYARDSGGVRAMLLCRVACGNLMDVTRTGQFGLDDLAPNSRFHAVKGNCFSHPEFIIYKEEQCYPEYIILYTRA